MGSWCQVCNSKVAALYCTADLAKLCLLCDRDIHSANALSLRHTRSQVCDNCRAQAASVVCFSHNISLCQTCDRHSHCSSADRTPVQGFTGCPSTIELASVLGFDLGSQAQNFNLSLDDGHNKLFKQSLGRPKDEVYEQLVEMRMRALALSAQQQQQQVEDAASYSFISIDQARRPPPGQVLASEIHLNSNIEVVTDGRRSRCNAILRYNNKKNNKKKTSRQADILYIVNFFKFSFNIYKH
ncbi:hypothetical protein M0R45_033888 [Rubus argutus]|uniref:B box-type domain-containing protein n=1 Tax=Rubus argutus TaxID=59490 RepID=A0AAW1WLS4_RUBAR